MRTTWIIAALCVGAQAVGGCGGDSSMGVDGGPPADTGTGVPDTGPRVDGTVGVDGNVGTDGGTMAGCPTPTSGPTTHTANVAADETWTADASPHLVPNDLTVSFGATLTIEACAEVRIGAGRTVTVRGNLVSAGTAEQPVLIHSNGAGAFAQIRNYGDGTTIRLTHTTVDEGGDPLTTLPHVTAMIFLQGVSTEPTQGLLHVDNVTVRGSASNGVLVMDGAGFSAESTMLTVTGSALHPVSVWASAADTLPAGTYTGNTIDEVLIPGTGGGGAGSISRDATWHDPGVPYRIGSPTTTGELVVDAGGTGLATLTLDPGVELRFIRDGQFWVERFAGAASYGALIAVGTAADPIVLTSAEATPAAGDWAGLHFASTPHATTRLEYVTVEYAGGETVFGSSSCAYPMETINWAAIRIAGEDPPASQFITSSTITDSATHGIDRGWPGTAIDFLPTNTFMDIGRCRQTLPRPTGMPCPTTPPCP